MPSRTMLRHHSCYSLISVESPFLCNTNLCNVVEYLDFPEKIIGLNLENNLENFSGSAE